MALTAAGQYHEVSPDEFARGVRASEWMILVSDPPALDLLLANGQWLLAHSAPSTPMWTDDFSNMFSVLNLH
jgi:hypothetical protein